MPATPNSRQFVALPFLEEREGDNNLRCYSLPWRTVWLRTVGEVDRQQILHTLADHGMAFSHNGIAPEKLGRLYCALISRLSLTGAELAEVFALSADDVDTIGLLSYLRLEIQLDEEMPRLNGSVLAELERSDLVSEARFGLMLRQSHHITGECERALAPARLLPDAPSSGIDRYIESERGHQVFFTCALTALGADPDLIPVMPAAELLIEQLANAAQVSLVELSFLIDGFEGLPSVEPHPVLKALDAAGYSVSAHYIQRHSDINLHGAHDKVAFGILASLRHCDLDTATAAILAHRHHFALKKRLLRELSAAFAASAAING